MIPEKPDDNDNDKYFTIIYPIYGWMNDNDHDDDTESR